MNNNMKKKLYLGEVLELDNVNVLDMTEKENVCILSNTGSGKTYYVMNVLCTDDTKKYLYLCDNSNLKNQVMLEDNTKNSKGEILDKDFEYTKKYFGKRNVECMTYKEFGIKVRFNNNFIQQYDVIIADEFHNLFNYYGFCSDGDLANAIEKLGHKYFDTKIIGFTATPYDITQFEDKYKDMFNNWYCINYLNDNRVRRYVNEREMKYSSGNNIPKILKEYKKDGFDYLGYKALIFTREISQMKSIEEGLKKEGFNPICLWSINNTDYPLNDEQLRVREHLITTGKLADEYNILIINRAMETGINITDESFKYCIVNTTNITQQIQARGRLRFNISLFATLSSESTLDDIRVTIPNEYLDVYLTKEDKDRLVEYFSLKDNKGRIIKWTRLKEIIENSGYKVTDKKIKRKGKQIKTSIINEYLNKQ